jgi:hypothetical protein
LAFLAALIFVLASPPQTLAIAGASATFLAIALAVALAFLAEFFFVLALVPQALAVSVLDLKYAGFKSRSAAQVSVGNWGCVARADCHHYHGRAGGHRFNRIPHNCSLA